MTKQNIDELSGLERAARIAENWYELSERKRKTKELIGIAEMIEDDKKKAQELNLDSYIGDYIKITYEDGNIINGKFVGFLKGSAKGFLEIHDAWDNKLDKYFGDTYLINSSIKKVEKINLDKR